MECARRAQRLPLEARGAVDRVVPARRHVGRHGGRALGFELREVRTESLVALPQRRILFERR